MSIKSFPNQRRSRSKISFALDKEDDEYWMQKVPKDDFRLNTVSNVNPFIYLNEVNQKEINSAYNKKLEKMIMKRKLFNKTKVSKEKFHLQLSYASVGPEWFQNLSPKQAMLVDGLKKRLMADLERKRVDETQQFFNDLGVTPNIEGKIVRRTMLASKTDPVKFLVMIQDYLSKREELEYENKYFWNMENNIPQSSFSVNERLCLSAVFHYHFPILVQKLDKILPDPPEKPRVKWGNKKPKKKKKYKSPYLEPQPINEMCWYEERALKDLENKVKREMKAQEARDRAKEARSVKPSESDKKTIVLKNLPDNSKLSDSWSEAGDEAEPEVETSKPKIVKKTSLDQLVEDMHEDEYVMRARDDVSDKNLYEDRAERRTDVTLGVSPVEEHMHPLDILLKKVTILFPEASTGTAMYDQYLHIDHQGISSTENQTQIIDGKLKETSSKGVQTTYSPEYGNLIDLIDDQIELRSQTFTSHGESNDEGYDLDKFEHMTSGYFDYYNSDDEPSPHIMTLMYEVKEDLHLLETVDGHVTYKQETDESQLTLPKDGSYLSIDSYLYESDYELSLSKAMKQERKKRKEKMIMKMRKAFTVECTDEKCGKVSSEASIPMDEFELAQQVIASHPPENQLQLAVKYLSDKGDPLAILPDIHLVPKLIRWFEKRQGIRYPLTEADKEDLMHLSRVAWDAPHYKVTKLPIPEIRYSKNMTWKDVHKVKAKAAQASHEYTKMLKEQLVTGARNFYPSMYTEWFDNKLSSKFQDNYYAYLPSKVNDTLAFRPWRREGTQQPDPDCGNVRRCGQKVREEEEYEIN